MTNTQFLQSYVLLQQGMMFDHLFDLEFATICFCEDDESPFWNNAFITSALGEKQINTVEAKLTSLSRKSAFYFENSPTISDFQKKLENLKYKKEAEDALMFYVGEKVSLRHPDWVKKVNTEQELETFLMTFDQCYQKDDPKNPYGEVGHYLEVTRKIWHKHHNNGRTEYFIAYKNDLPVAVSTLSSFNGIGYISNVGSLRSVRGEGFGKLVTLHCVSESMRKGNSVHSLATEEGTNPNQFYKAIGFQTQFTALLISKPE